MDLACTCGLEPDDLERTGRAIEAVSWWVSAPFASLVAPLVDGTRDDKGARGAEYNGRCIYGVNVRLVYYLTDVSEG